MGFLAILAALALTFVGVLGNRELFTIGAVIVTLIVLIDLLLSRRTSRKTAAMEPIDGWAVLDREMLRHRRHGRQLTVCQLTLDTSDNVDPLVHAQEAAQLLSHQLRVDDTAFASREIVYLVLPETDAASAEVPIERLSDWLAAQGHRGSVRCATYPTDALTVRGLVERASLSTARDLPAAVAEVTQIHPSELVTDPSRWAG